MTPPAPPPVAIIGAGPAGLMAAEVLASAGQKVTIYERMASPARKFLMAGRGGLNLTHSEPLEAFLTRYGSSRPFVETAIRRFPPEALIAWAQGLDQNTFIGSSGRVFPESLKASPLLRAWLRRLQALQVVLLTGHDWCGWDDAGALQFHTAAGPVTAAPAATLLALGGASWPKLGSSGEWLPWLAARGVSLAPWQPSNCGLRVAWSDRFLSSAEGQPLKRVALICGSRISRGELVVTRSGLEGGAAYALGPDVRQALSQGAPAKLYLDLRPDLSADAIQGRLAAPRGKQSLANHLRKHISLAPVAIALLNEARAGRLPEAPEALARLIKSVPLECIDLAGLARAISSVGGIQTDAVGPDFGLTACPGIFVAGEMLDWDAPTGGYLLQAAFATGVAAAHGMLEFLAEPASTQANPTPSERPQHNVPKARPLA